MSYYFPKGPLKDGKPRIKFVDGFWVVVPAKATRRQLLNRLIAKLWVKYRNKRLLAQYEEELGWTLGPDVVDLLVKAQLFNEWRKNPSAFDTLMDESVRRVKS